mgnify:CR=1 FL=1
MHLAWLCQVALKNVRALLCANCSLLLCSNCSFHGAGRLLDASCWGACMAAGAAVAPQPQRPCSGTAGSCSPG